MPNFIDISGQTFGRLTAVEPVKLTGRKEIYWLCQCECGATKHVMSQNLREGKIRSCGCLLIETTRNRLRVHGHTTNKTMTAEYRAWVAMRERCSYEKHASYHNYGGRGIAVCAEWQDDFKAFYDHIGPKPSPKHSIDRIDNERGYEPGNVRWATRAEQNANQRKRVKKKHLTQRREVKRVASAGWT